MTRFIKIGSKGEDLALDAAKWMAVRDNSSGLIWTVKEMKVTSQRDAEAKVAALKLHKAKWRLPTVEELFLLADRSRFSPAIDTTYFPDCKSDWYWTSTPAAHSPDGYAWLVGFGDGSSDWGNRDGSGFVRAVRPSQ